MLKFWAEAEGTRHGQFSCRVPDTFVASMTAEIDGVELVFVFQKAATSLVAASVKVTVFVVVVVVVVVVEAIMSTSR